MKSKISNTENSTENWTKFCFKSDTTPYQENNLYTQNNANLFRDNQNHIIIIIKHINHHDQINHNDQIIYTKPEIVSKQLRLSNQDCPMDN